MKYGSIFQNIGNTPLVKLEKIVPNPLVTVLLKLEFFNPSGSIKDRIVLHIINKAEEAGLLSPGGTIIENTSGNTGAALAMLGAARGYRVILVMPDKVSREKQEALTAYGAKVILAPTDAPPDSREHYVNQAIALHKATPGSFRVNQYDNPQNPEAHYLSTGPEIWAQTKGEIDYFIAAGSTGGTISGVGKFLKEKNPAIKTLMPDPVGSIYYPYFKTGNMPKDARCTYYLEGIGEDHMPKAIDFSLIDQVMQVTDRDAFATCHKLAEREGILAGGSTGANVWSALELAKSATRPMTIVTIAPDGGIKYLSKIYNDAWMQAQHLA